MEPQFEPIKVPRSLFWDLKLKRGRFNGVKGEDEWEEEFSSGIGSSEYEQDSPPDLNAQERMRKVAKIATNGGQVVIRSKERESGRDDLDEGVYCTSESDDQDLPHQLKDALMMEIADDSCSTFSGDMGPPGDEQHFNEFAEALRQQASKQTIQSVNGIPMVGQYPPPVLKVPQHHGEMKFPTSSASGTQTLGMTGFNAGSININMVPVIAPTSSASNNGQTIPKSVAPVVSFPVLNWPYRPMQCYQAMSHQIMPTTTSTWSGKPPPGLLYSEIVPPVFKKAIDIAAGAPPHVPIDMANRSPGYLPLPQPPQPVYPLSNLIKTTEQHEELQQWMSQQQSQQKFDINMICEICEDRATGLHYGIVTCEGCKGFFKRTVQNKRIYTCIGEEKCEVTKALRNRCQFCRFRKCIQKGMILAAVREDRMPGGRNNGSMYRNIYRVKYKRKRRYSLPVSGQSQSVQSSFSSPQAAATTSPSRPKSNPLEETLRQNCRNSMLPSIGEGQKQEVSEKVEELAESARVIQKLLECETKQNIGNLTFSLGSQNNVAQVLAQLGDDIVSQLVDWTQKLPYYDRLPLPLHTELLTSKWHELVVLTMVVHISRNQPPSALPSNQNECVKETASRYLERIHHFMRNMLQKSITYDELNEEIGEVVNKMTFILSILQNLGVSQEEYVCLKVLVLLSQGEGETNASLMEIQDLYLAALDHFITQRYPRQWSRLGQLLLLIPQISSVAAHLLKNRMIYVPFLLNNNLSH